MGESAEDLLLADPALSKVDRFGWPGAGLSRGELAEGTVRPRCVVVPQVLVQQPAQMAFALGACGGLRRILIPSAVNTASKELVNWPARSLIRNLTEAARCLRSIRKVRAAWVAHGPSGYAVIPATRTPRVPCSMTIRT